MVHNESYALFQCFTFKLVQLLPVCLRERGSNQLKETGRMTTTDLLTSLRAIIPLLAPRAESEVIRVPALRASRGADVVPLRRDDLLKEAPRSIGIPGPHESLPLLQPETQTRSSAFNERGNVLFPRYRGRAIQRLHDRHPSVLDIEPVR